ncbi:MAG: hypothetical protein HYY16_05255 [Planctomycetes bacterium]|nr:hypothetical protein [Planctomycetota bacterium]
MAKFTSYLLVMPIAPSAAFGCFGESSRCQLAKEERRVRPFLASGSRGIRSLPAALDRSQRPSGAETGGSKNG